MKRFQAPFYGQIFKLVLPIVLQSLLSSAVNSADVVMLGFVGQSAVSAVSLASQYAHTLFIAFNGLGTGVTILCAQYFGKRDYRAIEVIQAIALRVSLAISLVFALCAAAIPGPMMRLFTDDSGLVALGAGYIRILSVCYLCWGVTEVYIAILRSTGRVAAGTVLNAIAVAINIVLNMVFIFGWLGLPKMGVSGVALATTVSRLIELVLCFAVSARSGQVKLRPSQLFANNKLLSRDFVRLSLPAMANAAVFGLAFSTFTAVIGHLGSDAVAANSLGNIVQNFGNIMSFGLASAGGILLGQKMGKGGWTAAAAADCGSGYRRGPADTPGPALCADVCRKRRFYRYRPPLPERHAADQQLSRDRRRCEQSADRRNVPRRRRQPLRAYLRYFCHVVLCRPSGAYILLLCSNCRCCGCISCSARTSL